MYEGSKTKVHGRSLEHRCRNSLKMIGAATEGLKKEEKMVEKKSDKERGGGFIRFEWE